MPPVPSARGLPDWFYELPAVARTVWLTRPDLHEALSADRTAFLAWCLIEGRAEYRCFDPASGDFDPDLLERPWGGCPDGVDPPVTELMHGVWARRPDLRAEFDLRTRAGAAAFLGWYFVEGMRELDLAPLLTPAQVEAVARPAVPPGMDPVLTRVMLVTHGRRPDLQAAFDIALPQGRAALAEWFLTEGLREIGDGRLAGVDGRRWFWTQSGEAKRRFGLKISNGPFRIWQNDPALRDRYPADRDGLAGFRAWAMGEGGRAYPFLREAADRPTVEAPAIRRSPLLFPGGVNLVGNATADTGIGEDARAAARALRAVGVPHVVVNLKPGSAISTGERVDSDRVVASPVYDTTLFCATGMEMARIAAAEGPSFLEGQRVIGCWPWELPAWPAPWAHAFDLVDEVWASTRYTAAAYASATRTPVRRMPMTVTLPGPAPLSRQDFGLPGQDFLFLFAFDASSYLARKNPLAVIDAFRLAFPAGDEPVGLVLKVMRADSEDVVWREVAHSAALDPRIHVVERTSSRYELVALYESCDALVSLHRAEGFGRVLAEMMLLGKPVIATGWSGNVDFLTPETGCPVPFRLVPVGPGQYPYGDGMEWAEPDLGIAARWMHRLAAEPGLAASIGTSASTLIRHRYSPEAVGRQYQEALGLS